MKSPYRAEESLAYPVLVRPGKGRVIAGVAAGLAENLGIDVLYVRAVLAGLALFSGMGLFIYGGVWIATRQDAQLQAPTSRHHVSGAVSVLLIVAALLGGSTFFFVTGTTQATVVPLIIIAAGALIAWQAYDRGFGSMLGILSAFFGAALVIAGTIVTVIRWNDGGLGVALVAVWLTLLGFGALVIPLMLRLWRSLAEEKAQGAVSQERAEVAARLHDSVLQTLALIQKRAADPSEVQRLARAQERELRAWLFEPESATEQSVFGALAAACSEVESLFDVRIHPVTVGEDAALGHNAQLCVQAAREAMMNAGKHAQVRDIDVYAEILGGELSVFVRDRGVGFDESTVAPDRHGIADSIRGRMESVGGTAVINSSPGAGTEVELTVRL